MPKENNKMQVDIENLFKQNVNDLTSIKELYSKLQDIENKILQIKYIDSNLANKLKKEYEKLKKIILDENIQVQLNNSINEIYSHLEIMKYYVTPEMFGAKGDGVTDDSVAIQKAIDSLTNGGTVIFTPKTYKLSKGIKINKKSITLKGTRSTNLYGTVIKTDNSSDQPVISVGYGNDSMLVGGSIENIAIMGNNTRQSFENRINRVGLHLKDVSEFNLTNVYISGFTKEGVNAIDWWDSTINCLEIRACGTEKTHSGLTLDCDNDSSNSLHFFGLHIEECPYQLKIDKICSNIHFVGSKFERGASMKLGDIDYLIYIHEGVYAVTFTSCFFTSALQVPHILVKNRLTTFNSCTFSTGNVNGMYAIKCYSSNTDYGKRIIINGCTFDCLSKIVNGIELSNECIFTNNNVTFKEDSGAIKPIIFNSNNIITGNIISNTHTSGHIFQLNSSGNKIENNSYQKGVFVFDSKHTSNILDTKVNIFSTVTGVNINFAKAHQTNILWNGSTATTLTKDNLLNPFNGCTFKIIANNGNLTLAKSMIQNSGGNIIIPSGGVIVLVYNATLSNWFIESKSW